MKIKTEVWYLPRPARFYPGSFPLHFEERIKDILETRNFVHFFSGLSKVGYTIDIKKEVNPKLIANVEEKLLFPNNYFDGGFADPPYNKLFAKKLYNCDYPKWSKWTKELVRIVKPGKKIAIMQNYIVPKLEKCTIIKIIIILGRIKHYPKIVTIQVKNSLKERTLKDFL